LRVVFENAVVWAPLAHSATLEDVGQAVVGISARRYGHPVAIAVTLFQAPDDGAGDAGFLVPGRKPPGLPAAGTAGLATSAQFLHNPERAFK
jgi:hypothetical protein